MIKLFGKDQAGKSYIIYVKGFMPYFYASPKRGDNSISIEDITEIAQRYGFHIRTETVQRFEGIGYQATPIDMVRIETVNPKEVRDLRQYMVDQLPGIRLWETDILFRDRFMVDKGLKGMGWFKVPENKTWVNASEVYPIPIDEAPTENAPLRKLAFDIETPPPPGGEFPDPTNSSICMLSMAFSPEYQGMETLALCVRKNANTQALALARDATVFFDTESEMLRRFSEIMQDYDPDLISGYKINTFDIPFIGDRCRARGEYLKVGRDRSSWRYDQGERAAFNEYKKVYIPGRIVVDMLPLTRKAVSLKQYNLKYVASQLLKEQKLDMKPAEIGPLWADDTQFQKVIDYGRRDSLLVLRLLDKLQLMDKYIALANASGCLLQEIIDGGQSKLIEGLLLRRFGQNARVMPPKPTEDSPLADMVNYKGAIVIEPEKGLHEDVVILDYKSLYPSIVIAYNLCYSTVNPPQDTPQGDLNVSPVGGRFVKAHVFKGIMPEILEELLAERFRYKKLMKQAKTDRERDRYDAKQYSFKILLNSFYGYAGYVRSRLFTIEVAEAVTGYGRVNIERTQKVIKDTKLLEVGGKLYQLRNIAGDTDSVFVKCSRYQLTDDKQIPLDVLEAIGIKLAAKCSEGLPKPMELAFEAVARRALFIVKKHYALYRFEKQNGEWKGKIKAKGIETVRRDWSDIVAKTITTCLEMIMKDGNPNAAIDYAKGVCSHIRTLDVANEPMDDYLLSRKLSRPIDQYKSKQVHIELIKRMADRGEQIPDIGDRISFIIVKNGWRLFSQRGETVEYAAKSGFPLDADYYLDKQLVPPLFRLLGVFGVTYEGLRTGTPRAEKWNLKSVAGAKEWSEVIYRETDFLHKDDPSPIAGDKNEDYEEVITDQCGLDGETAHGVQPSERKKDSIPHIKKITPEKAKKNKSLFDF